MMNSSRMIRLVPVVILIAVSSLYFMNGSKTVDSPNPSSVVRKLSAVAEEVKLQMFEEFIVTHSKNYESEEERTSRYEIFKANLVQADEYNQLEKERGGTGVHGVTLFSDLTDEEFKSMYLGGIRPQAGEGPILAQEKVDRESDQTATLTGFKDWTGIYTTPVKNQGQCNCCWAFVTTEQIESDAIRLGLGGMTPNTPLSPQQLVSCFANNCNPNGTVSAMRWVNAFGGLVPESAFPFTATNGVPPKCPALSTLKSKAVITVNKVPNPWGINDDSMLTAFNTMWPYGTPLPDEPSMAEYVMTTGPIAITVTFDTLKQYLGGITALCPTTGSGVDDRINHAVQAVGINIPASGPAYWIVRNQWTTAWGNKGFGWLPYGVDACGLANGNVGATNFYTNPQATGVPYPPVAAPVGSPVASPTAKPVSKPVATPTADPVASPTAKPVSKPVATPTAKPVAKPVAMPTSKPLATPTEKPAGKPTEKPTGKPTGKPVAKPTGKPAGKPSAKPTKKPSAKPTLKPSAKPTKKPV